MARARTRRRSFSGYRNRRPSLDVVRIHATHTLTADDNVRRIDLLEGAQTESATLYRKDLTPASVVAVRGHYSWYLPAGTTATTGFLGVGLIVDSTRRWAAISEAGVTGDQIETIEGGVSPLDSRGRYQKWHYRDVSFISNPGEAGFPAHKQLRDNMRSIRPRTTRRVPTVDDSYYLYLDAQTVTNPVVMFELSIWLRKSS